MKALAYLLNPRWWSPASSLALLTAFVVMAHLTEDKVYYARLWVTESEGELTNAVLEKKKAELRTRRVSFQALNNPALPLVGGDATFLPSTPLLGVIAAVIAAERASSHNQAGATGSPALSISHMPSPWAVTEMATSREGKSAIRSDNCLRVVAVSAHVLCMSCSADPSGRVA